MLLALWALTQTLLIVLKLTGTVDLNWWIVAIPSLTAGAFLAATVGIAMCTLAFFGKLWNRKR